MALARGEPLLYAAVGQAELAAMARTPEQLAALRALELRSLIAAPMCGRRATLGVISFAMDSSGRSYSSADLALAQDVAVRAALLLENARLYAAERRARAASDAAAARALFLADAGALLADALDYEETLRQLARLTVPRFADLCVVYIVGDDGALRRSVAAHSDPAQEAQLADLAARAPLISEPVHPAALAVRTRSTLRDPAIHGDLAYSAAQSLAQAQAAQSLIPDSHLVVPLMARQRVLGATSFGRQGAGRAFSDDDQRVAEDLTRRAALAIDNARLYRDAQEAIRVRDSFLSIASHELKTPLTSLLGQAQLLQRRLPTGATLSERDERALSTVVQQGQRLSSLISAMLDISRLETGQITVERAPLDLGALVRQVSDELQPSLERHTLSVALPPEPVWVSGDAMRLEQVLMNLLQNAVKYSPGGGPIRVRLERHETNARLSISDRGIGIPAAAIPQLFQRFYRVERAEARHLGGLGVGLYVVREVVTLHGGQVTVESVEGQGSVFIVTLPLL